MRLERLEISGFKSFSDRAELAFDQGVTAIVGPNGCGKSNVADAITWVLGEQSAKSLRGEKMEDVIFSGSDARKAGATAEVRLRLSGLLAPGDIPQEAAATSDDEPAFTGEEANGAVAARVAALAASFTRDVEVTRRLYRSGESEYLIDGEVCRLRDVHELLMDTGLGAKAYSIIEQGKIGMILSSRPADRRQLIEEAAGITKYKSRRRAAELKLDAAQQNLTRIDDIVYEVGKQRGALKRQAARARRYRTLREELRRWEKVLFAGRYRELARAIEDARTRLTATREREQAAAARLAAVEAESAALRIEQAETDAHAGKAREAAHGAELEISRLQQQQALNRREVEMLGTRAASLEHELHELEARREPTRVALHSRRVAAEDAARAREEAAGVLMEATDAHGHAQQRIEGLETDVEGVRVEVIAAMNGVVALRHAVEHATAQDTRVGETLGKLDVETDDVRRESDKVGADRAQAGDALDSARARRARVREEQAAIEMALAAARVDHDVRSRDVRAREQELAGIDARLRSLEELAASRAEFGDAARMVLVQANGHVGQRGAVADYLEVDPRYERAVESCLGELLQHVIVERHDQAAAGLSLVREHDAGRCGFVVVDPGSNGFHPREALRLPGIVSLADVVRVSGAYASTLHKVLPDAYVAETFEAAVACARQTSAPVATIEGDVFRGPHLVSGGAKAEARGILATRREIKELGERAIAVRDDVARLAGDVSRLAARVADATAAIADRQAEQHRLEMEIVAGEGQLARAHEDAGRLARKSETIALERRRAEEERATLDRRRAEAQASIVRLEEDHGLASARLAEAQTRLAAAREAVADTAARAAEVRATHAGLVERAAALAIEVTRIEEGARDLEMRVSARRSEHDQGLQRRSSLLADIDAADHGIDDRIRDLDTLREALHSADERVLAVRAAVEAQELLIRGARGALDAVRAEAGALEIARATAEADLAHLAQACADGVDASLDQVLAEVEALEAGGLAVPDAAAIAAEDPDPDEDPESAVVGASLDPAADDGVRAVAEEAGAPSPTMTAEEAIAALKRKIERLGPVNMMAIGQFDELETRHGFLTSQRKDLTDSIAQTVEAIRRIDETTRKRFTEAFTAIQANFQVTFGTLFGGGRASLTLLDENDPLETGIEIVASPPGKRLQSVQLLSGGEKALTAIALMFAIFKYKPSPFCLLDEIDAPLDDANVSRFVEMLRAMLDRTQFILITHNRRTMEIASRLYGVTMEEPGVSKLISVQLN